MDSLPTESDNSNNGAVCFDSLLEHERILGDDRPSSFAECVAEDGTIDSDLHRSFLSKEDDLELAEKNTCRAVLQMLEEEEKEPSGKTNKKKRKKRSVKTLRPYHFDEHGNIQFLQPRETMWFKACCQDSDMGLPIYSKLFSKFRRRFRMPFDEHRRLLGRICDHELFLRWMGCDGSGTPASPLGLLLLGALRYLGRGLTFDDLEEYTAISEETHRQFFHKFIQFGAESLYPEYVRYPTTAEEHATHSSEFQRGGLNGAGFSSDATNVIM